VVEGDGEFVDDGGEGNSCGFVASAEVLMEAAQDRVHENDSKCGHAQGAAPFGAAPGDVALVFLARTAVVTKRGGAYEGGHFAFG